MASPNVVIKYGPNYSRTFSELNNGTYYRCRTYDTLNSPEQDIELGTPEFGVPFVQRVGINERVFSIAVSVLEEPFSTFYHDRVNELKKVFGQGSVRVYVSRAGTGTVFITGECEQIVEGKHPCDFDILLTCADPIWTLEGGEETGSVSIGASPPSNPVIPIPDYFGTAESEPTFTFQPSANGGVWRYYREISVTNRSDLPLSYYPVCIDLGNIASQVGTKFFEVGGGDQRIKDIRLESPGGAKKLIYVRDIGERGGAWHTSVKVWTVLYSLLPGETKKLRVYYGNPNCTIDPEASSIKPVFTMYYSTNNQWIFEDFLPAQNQSQTRNMPWVAYTPNRMNLDWIKYPHPHFDNPNAPYTVPCAGGRVKYYGRGRGFAGVALNLPVPLASVAFDFQLSTNAKAPFVFRRLHPDGRYFDEFAAPYGPSAVGKSVYAQLTAAASTGATVLTLDMVTRGGDTIAVADSVAILLNNGATHRAAVTAVNPTTRQITITPGLPSAAAIGKTVQQFVYIAGNNITFPTTDQPYGVAFGIRVDIPTLTLGDWYYGASNHAEINFNTTKNPLVTSWGSAGEVDMQVTGYQLSGRFGNQTVGEYIGIHTVLPGITDKIVVDCKNRTCLYYKWNGSSFDEPEDRFEALFFDEEVRKHWIHISPAFLFQTLEFIQDGGSNFRNLTVTITYPTRYL